VYLGAHFVRRLQDMFSKAGRELLSICGSAPVP
jgi:hypothetical protein